MKEISIKRLDDLARAPSTVEILELVADPMSDAFFAALEHIHSLVSLSIFTGDYQATKGWTKPPANLKNLWIWDPNPSDWLALRALGIQSGLARLVTMKGQIGDWYESGKETRTREFMSSDQSVARGSFPLKAGDELTIFDVDSALLFKGPLYTTRFEDAWTQKGIKSNLWEKWFTSRLPAELTTYESLAGCQFYIQPWPGR